MIIHTKSSTPLAPVMLEPSASGLSHVWLRKNINRGLEYFDGSDFDVWEADEVYFHADVTEEFVIENFAALWAAHEQDGVTDKQLLLSRISELQEAVAELGDMIAGG